MTDVLSGGPPDQPPRRWPKVAVGAVVAALAIGAGVGQVWQRGAPVALPLARGRGRLARPRLPPDRALAGRGGPVHLVPGRIAGGYLSGALLAV